MHSVQKNTIRLLLLITISLILLLSVSAQNEDFTAATNYKEIGICGCSGSFTQEIKISNTGDVPSLYYIMPSGKTAAWQTITAEPFILIPGQTASTKTKITPECKAAFGEYELVTNIKTETNTQKEIRQKLSIINCNDYTIEAVTESGKDKIEMACETNKEFFIKIENKGPLEQKHILEIIPEFATLEKEQTGTNEPIAIPAGASAISKAIIAPSCDKTGIQQVTAKSTLLTAIPTNITVPAKNDTLIAMIYSKKEAYQPEVSPEKINTNYKNKTAAIKIVNKGKFNATYEITMTGSIIEETTRTAMLQPKQATKIAARILPDGLEEGAHNITITINANGEIFEEQAQVILKKSVGAKISEWYNEKIRPRQRTILTIIIIIAAASILAFLISYARFRKKEKFLNKMIRGPEPIIEHDKEGHTATKTFRYAEKGKETEIAAGDERFDATKLIIMPNKNIPEFTITIKQKDTAALQNQQKAGLPEKLYSYFTIGKHGILTKEIDKAILRFRVRKTWLNAEELGNKQISIYKIGPKIDELKAHYAGSDEQYEYYEADARIPGEYAIGEKTSPPDFEIITKETKPAHQKAAEKTREAKLIKEVKKTKGKEKKRVKIPWELIIPIIIAAAIITGFIMLAAQPSKELTTNEAEIEDTIKFVQENKLDKTAYYQIWDKNTNKKVNLSNHFKSPQGNKVRFGVSQTTNVTTTLNDDEITFIPKKDWYGIETIYLAASDGQQYLEDADITLIVRNYEATPLNNLKRGLETTREKIKENITILTFLLVLAAILIIAAVQLSKGMKKWKEEEEKK